MPKNEELEGTKRLMAALGRMPPKQHSDMKIGKPKATLEPSPKRPRGRPRKIKPGK